MEISPTGYVVLGMLNWGPRTGYEIKQLVDKSTRFFWAASYGQIYPELKRLTEQGLVSGKDDPKSARNRKVYRLTAKGRRELDQWMQQPPETFEMRNEGLLKLFLASGDSEDEIARHIGEMRGHADGVAARLRGIREELATEESDEQLCLRFGIEMNEWIAEWCERRERELAVGAGTKRRAA
jgi:PadR family transcriptional regulator, regulatory protein AphA